MAERGEGEGGSDCGFGASVMDASWKTLFLLILRAVDGRWRCIGKPSAYYGIPYYDLRCSHHAICRDGFGLLLPSHPREERFAND